jgi:hypothetical protein
VLKVTKIASAAIGVIVIGILTACSASGNSLPPDIGKVAAKVGCKSPTPESHDELLVHQAVECADGRWVFTFNTNEARDTFQKIAEMYGPAYEQGNGYLVESR